MSTSLKLKSLILSVRDPNFSPIIDTSGISTPTTNNSDSKDVDYGPSFEELSESETGSRQEDFVPNASSMSQFYLLYLKVCCIYCFETLSVVASCENSHRIMEWKVHLVPGQLPTFNLLVAVATFCSGKYLLRIHLRQFLY